MSEGGAVVGEIAGTMSSLAFALVQSGNRMGQEMRVARIQRQAFDNMDAVGAAGVRAVAALRALVADRDDEIAELRAQLADANRRLLTSRMRIVV